MSAKPYFIRIMIKYFIDRFTKNKYEIIIILSK